MKNKDTAIYVRVSTMKDSQKDSPEHQKGLCEEKARSLNVDVQHVYEDKDTGTSIVARNEIQRLISDAQKGLFDTIIFASLSRFSRDTLDSLDLKRKLVNALGIRLISIEETYDSYIEDDELKFQIISAVNQKLSEQISLSSKRGIRQSALKGNFTGSITPFGYTKTILGDRKTLIPDENTQHVVKLIYDLYTTQKMGDKAIVNHLNENLIPTYRNGVWGLSSVQRILKNEVYTGENVFGKYEVRKVYNDINNMSDREKKMFQTNESKWERSPFKTHDAIIDDETFKLAQEIRLQRGGGKRGGVRNVVNVFSGFVYCKHCNSAMVSMKSKGGKSKREGREYRYLICSKRRRQGEHGCENNLWIPYDEFRKSIIDEVSGKLKKIINVSEITTEHKGKFIKIDEIDHSKKIKKYEKNIETNRKLLAELRRQNMMGDIDDSQFNYEKIMYVNEISSYQNQLDILRENVDKKINLEMVHEEINKALNNLIDLNFDKIDELRLVLQKLIEKLVISNDGTIEIYTPLGQLES